jgi:hypothetical protein
VTMGKDINEHIITYTRRYKWPSGAWWPCKGMNDSRPESCVLMMNWLRYPVLSPSFCSYVQSLKCTWLLRMWLWPSPCRVFSW